LAGYDIGRLWYLIKITSGVFKGSLAYRSSMELVIINFEPTDLLGQLSQAVLVSGIKSGLAKELNKELQVALKSVKNGNIGAAVNQIRGFQASVQAQSGKGIPPDLADAWLEGARRLSEDFRAYNKKVYGSRKFSFPARLEIAGLGLGINPSPHKMRLSRLLAGV
jgi:hypothetical protein